MKALGTRLQFSTAYHPQTDGQTERVNQILEDMLRACILDFGGSWKKYLHFAEFAYNNSYQTSIRMAPYEVLYGRKCRSPICWDETTPATEVTEEILRQSVEVVELVRRRLQAAQDRQKALADRHRRPLRLDVGQRVLLRVTPLRRIAHLGRRGKLSPRYIGPFEVVEKVNDVAFRLRLPEDLSKIHDVFHVSQLKPWIESSDNNEGMLVTSKDIELQNDLTYKAKPVKIVDRQVKRLRNKVIPQVRVQWDDLSGKQDTWEDEACMRREFPFLFSDDLNVLNS